MGLYGVLAPAARAFLLATATTLLGIKPAGLAGLGWLGWLSDRNGLERLRKQVCEPISGLGQVSSLVPMTPTDDL